MNRRGAFRMISAELWRSMRDGGLSPLERLVLLSLETSPPASCSGVHFFPLTDVCSFTGMSKKAVIRVIGQLERRNLIVFDHSRAVVFVRGALYRQLATPTPNAKQTTGVRAHIDRLPEGSPAVLAFRKAYEETLDFESSLDALYYDGSDTNPDGVWDTPSDRVSGRGSGGVGDTREKRKKKGEKEKVKRESIGALRTSTPTRAPEEAKSECEGSNHSADKGTTAVLLSSLPRELQDIATRIVEDARGGSIPRPLGRERLRAAGLSAFVADALIRAESVPQESPGDRKMRVPGSDA